MLENEKKAINRVHHTCRTILSAFPLFHTVSEREREYTVQQTMNAAPSGGATEENRKAADLSPEERTPKQLKFSEPDLTVVVGEGENAVEFYHYKHLLAASCPFFDDMFSSGMKEAKENRIVFPDKDPDAWLKVCQFLDSTAEEKNTEAILLSSIVPFTDHNVHLQLQDLMALLSWLDFLGLTKLANTLDDKTAKELYNFYKNGQKYPAFSAWDVCKLLPCPLVKKIMEVFVKYFFDWVLFAESRGDARSDYESNFIEYLHDDVLGDDLWVYLLSKVTFPERLHEFERKKLVKNDMFFCMLEACSKGAQVPGRFQKSLKEITGQGSEK